VGPRTEVSLNGAQLPRGRSAVALKAVILYFVIIAWFIYWPKM